MLRPAESVVCSVKNLKLFLNQKGLARFRLEAHEHLAGCVSCQDLFADLSSAGIAAKSLPAELTPPDRVWVSIRAQLEAEGIIRDKLCCFTPRLLQLRGGVALPKFSVRVYWQARLPRLS